MKKPSALRTARQAISVVGDLGVPLATGHWFKRDRDDNRIMSVCACGAILLALGIPKTVSAYMDTESEGTRVIRAVAKKLDITLDQAISLNNGFEDAGRDYTHAHGAYRLTLKGPRADERWYSFGQRLRKLVVA